MLDELGVLVSEEAQEHLLGQVIEVLSADGPSCDQELSQGCPEALEALEPLRELGVIGGLFHVGVEGCTLSRGPLNSLIPLPRPHR